MTLPAKKSRRVLVTRPQPVADEFAAKLRDEGFEAFVAPLTQYVEVDTDYGDLADYQGLIFTSVQAVNIFGGRNVERYIPVFAVGAATARAAERLGYRRVNTAQGDGEALAALLRQEKSKFELKRVLHPCGDDTAQDLGELLRPDGIYVDRAVVYKAELVDHLPPDVARALQEGDITTVTLFSARTAANFAKLMQAEPLKKACAELEAICISDRVAAEITPLPWRIVRTAANPHVDAVLDILRTKEEAAAGPVLLAEPVINAFGGLRPLANRLGLTPSTVQGWRERGVIPESRADSIFDAARADGIDYKNFMSKSAGGPEDGLRARNGSDSSRSNGGGGMASKDNGKGSELNNKERRRGQDRRQKHTPLDNRGQVLTDTYKGPDRRTGADRRAYHARQAQRIASEKWYFVNRSIIMSSIFTMAVLYGGCFLMAPELFGHKDERDMAVMQAKVDEMNKRLVEMQQQQQQRSLGNSINHGIESVQDAANGVVQSVGTVAQVATGVAANSEIGQDISSVFRVLANLKAMNSTSQGQTESKAAIGDLKNTLAASPTDINGLNAAVLAAKGHDKNLSKLLGGVDPKDIGAAALLLSLNEFRNNVNTQQPFDKDLALMQKYAGSDPEMQKSLQRLAPYAKNGILSRQALQEEFKGLASDIVMAKLQGQDVSVKDDAMKRIAKLVKVRKVDDIKGDSVDAVVARAQKNLDAGNVRAAMQELQSLQGAPAETAAPFMQQAQGNVMAEDTTDNLVQSVIGKLSGGLGGAGMPNIPGLTGGGDGAGGFSPDGIVDAVKGMMSGGGGGGATYISPGLSAGPQGGEQ